MSRVSEVDRPSDGSATATAGGASGADRATETAEPERTTRAAETAEKTRAAESDRGTSAAESDREMSAVRVGLGVAGVLALFVALGGFVVGPLEAAVAAAESALGSDYLLAASLGGVALVLATSAFASGVRSPRQAAMPEVERPTPVSAPGEEFDRQLSGWRARVPIVGSTVRETARRRLRRIAVRVIAADEGCAREAAERRLADGSWTDDPVAAAFLNPGAARPPLAARAAALRRGESWFEYAARRAVEALADRHETGRER